MSPDLEPAYDSPLEAWLHGVIKANIGKPRATREEVRELFKKYSDPQFLKDLPDIDIVFLQLEKLRVEGGAVPPRTSVNIDELLRLHPDITFGGMTDDSY